MSQNNEVFVTAENNGFLQAISHVLQKEGCRTGTATNERRIPARSRKDHAKLLFLDIWWMGASQNS